jgi:hypothetical protein
MISSASFSDASYLLTLARWRAALEAIGDLLSIVDRLARAHRGLPDGATGPGRRGLPFGIVLGNRTWR